MATNVRKKISDLTALTSASLDTVIVGVDNGTTYKIELDVLADAVTSRVNILDRDRLSSLESVTSSFETKGRSVISSSAQISALGFTSSSADLTSLNSFTSSQTTLNSAFTNGINARLQTSSFNDFSASVHNEIVAATNEQDLTPYVTDLVYNVLSSSVDSRIDNLEANSGSYLTSLNGAISSSSQLTSSFDTRYTLSGSVQPLPSNLVSSSAQITAFGFVSSSTTIPSGTISGSSQLTASYDTRYTLSGSVVSGTTPAGTISGSAQISAFGFVSGSYTTTSSFNSFTASAQAVTTGSNSFNGTQTITGSLIITTGSFVGSQILANTSSLYLTSGSNIYVQNNGLVEITGSLVVSGSTNLNVNSLLIGTGSGDEGGEIQLAIPQTNTSLTTKVIVDVYRNQLRLWEGGPTSKGVNIDLTKAPDNVAGELLWKASGMVAVGTFVTLDNLKCTVTASGNRGLSIAAVSTSFEADISGVYSVPGATGGGSTNNITYTTTASTSAFGWNFGAHGDTAIYQMRDKTNNRFYRITLMIGVSYISNFISIERLY